MEKTAYIILIIVTIAWIIAWIIGMFENIWLGIIGLVTIVGLGLLFIKALTDIRIIFPNTKLWKL